MDSPCNTCEKKDTCYLRRGCVKWVEWFKERWHEIRVMFRKE